MIGLLQRVTHANVKVDGTTVAEIGSGMLVLRGVEKGDTRQSANRLLERLLNYRVFEDEEGKMNLSLRDTQGDLLLVSQFTLAADTRKGNRPGFSTAMPPAEAELLFSHLQTQAKIAHPKVESGVFGANMQVSLCNDGPVTISLRVEPTAIK
jgi:D-tyrosyl-tRNA(Tyr) deacylase